MIEAPRTLAPALAIGLIALLATDSALEAQTRRPGSFLQRSRERQPQPARKPAAPASATVAKPAAATPVAQPVTAKPGAAAAAQSSTATERLPSSLLQDERAKAVNSRVSAELEGKSTEEVIQAAERRIQMLRGNNGDKPGAATITDATKSIARAAAAPAGTRPLIPEPVAKAARAPRATPAAPAGQPVLSQAAPAPVPPTAAPPAPAAPAGIPAPIPLRPRYDRSKKADSQVMEIESDESVMDNKKRVITFSGNVVVTEPRFNMTSDHLEIWLNDDSNLDGSSATPGNGAAADDQPAFKRAVATGGMVEIEKIGADGKIQIAKARRADYDTATGDIVLTGGPPTLQSGAGFINPKAADAVIVLRADGNHTVNGGTGPNKRTSITIPVKGGASTSIGPSFGGSLESMKKNKTNR